MTYHQHMMSILLCLLYPHLETEPSSLFQSHHHQTPTATHQLWHSSPLNTCSISLRSGAWNTILSSLEIVFDFLRVEVLLLEMTKKIPNLWILSLHNYWFCLFTPLSTWASFHGLLRKERVDSWPWSQRKMLMSNFTVHSVWSYLTLQKHSLFLPKWKLTSTSLTFWNHIKWHEVIFFKKMLVP